MGGTIVDRLTGFLDAYFGMAFELFSKSAHMPENGRDRRASARAYRGAARPDLGARGRGGQTRSNAAG
jgi:hypothetical protein